MRTAAFVFAAMLLAAPVFAHDVDGKWSGTLATPMGDVPLSMEFKADGTALTGAILGPDGTALPIKGTIDGATITFTQNIDAGGMPLELNYKGTVSAGEIKFTIEVFGMTLDFVAKKAQ